MRQKSNNTAPTPRRVKTIGSVWRRVSNDWILPVNKLYWVFTADLPIEWPGEMLTNRLLTEGCTRFENHIVETTDN